MSTTVVRYRAEHALELRTQEQAAGRADELEAWRALEASPWAETLLADGVPVACFGIQPGLAGRGEAWALVDARARAHAAALHRAALRLRDASGLERIEATVRCDFLPGHRWAQKMGFVVETPRARRYYPDGADCTRYVWLREAA